MPKFGLFTSFLLYTHKIDIPELELNCSRCQISETINNMKWYDDAPPARVRRGSSLTADRVKLLAGDITEAAAGGHRGPVTAWRPAGDRGESKTDKKSYLNAQRQHVGFI